MSRFAYVDGRYPRHADAAVHIEDRGFQFADGVYEVCQVRSGMIVDLTRHLDRLERSLSALAIAMPMSRGALLAIFRELSRRNGLRDGAIYLQITRGAAPRDHYFPQGPVEPTVVVTTRAADPAKVEAAAAAGIGVITVPDDRWGRVDIKTVGLLANVLAKQAARDAGAREAWFVDRDGFVTEGGSTNAWIVADGALVTRPTSTSILGGITRLVVMDFAAARGLRLEERAFTVPEALAADEAFVTSATSVVTAVVRIDGHSIGDGKPGPVARALRSGFHDIAELTPLIFGE